MTTPREPARMMVAHEPIKQGGPDNGKPTQWKIPSHIRSP